VGVSWFWRVHHGCCKEGSQVMVVACGVGLKGTDVTQQKCRREGFCWCLGEGLDGEVEWLR
jgi:hypothetical protein